MEQFTANEVRDWERAYKGTGAAKVFGAFADLLEAQERAVPVMVVNHVSSAEHDLPIGMKLYTHPAPSDAERLAEALRKIAREPIRPWPDPFAHSHEAFGLAVHATWCDMNRIAREALAAHSAPAQLATASVTDGLVDALRHQRQIDEDGVEVGVSRQAVDEAANILAMLAAAPQPQAAESHKGLLIGTTPSGVPYSLHGTKESVTAVSDMLEQAEVSRQLGADQPQSAEPVAYRAEWNGDVSDEGAYVYCQPNERDSEHQWEPLYTHPQPAQDAPKYQELLMAVSKKFPNESRHETALRYIRETELQSCEPKCDAAMAKESGR